MIKDYYKQLSAEFDQLNNWLNENAAASYEDKKAVLLKMVAIGKELNKIIIETISTI